MSNSNSDDGSFSKVGYSDAESLCGAAVNDGNGKKDEAPVKKIEVQLPPHFSAGNKPGGVNGSVASAASSFIPVTCFGKMKVAEEDASFATVAAKTCEKTGLEDVDGVATANKKSIAELEKDARLAIEFLEQQGKASDNPLSRMTGIPNTIGNISLHPPREKDDSSVGWSVVSSAAAYPKSTSGDDDDNSIAAGSTISGFDMISLGGSTRKQCKRCSFLNERCDNICKGCGAALVANPMLSADEQLARHLQQQEEQEAFKDIVCEERKRNSMGKQPLLFRAQTLADDIVAVVENYQMPHHDFKKEGGQKANKRFDALPAASLAILASRFIDHYDELSTRKKIDVCFCYTDDRPGRMAQIRQDGFGPNSKFGSDAEGAFVAFKRKHRTRYLTTVIESELGDQGVNDEGPTIITSPPKSDSWVAPNTKGWIAVVVQAERNEKRNSSFPSKDKSGHSWVFSRSKSLESLPLVFFDAKLIHDGTVALLVKSLRRTLTDFFEPYNTGSMCDSENSAKRRKMEDEDLALAQALHESLNGGFAESLPPEPGPGNDGDTNSGTFLPGTLELLREPIGTIQGLSVTSEEEKNFNSIIDAVLGPDEAVSGRANEDQSGAINADEELAAVEFEAEGGQDGMVQAAAPPPRASPHAGPPGPAGGALPPGRGGGMRELRVEDALLYMDDVKGAFGDRPEVYDEFLSIMKNYKSQEIDTPGVIARVSKLFHRHNNLILGFDKFLPVGYEMSVADLDFLGVATLADDVRVRSLEEAAASLGAQTTRAETVREEGETDWEPVGWRPGPGESWMEPIDAKSSSN